MKEDFEIKISPLISNKFGKFPKIFLGMLLIVFMFSMTLSPFIPSPLVNALIKTPFSYFRLIDTPSNLSSHTYSIFLSVYFLILFSKSKSSSLEYVLDNDNIG